MMPDSWDTEKSSPRLSRPLSLHRTGSIVGFRRYSDFVSFLQQQQHGSDALTSSYCRSLTLLKDLLPPANEVWGKVMFLHLCVILFSGPVFFPGLSLSGGGSLSEGGLSGGEGGFVRRDPPRTVDERGGRILLECFPVITCIFSQKFL